MAQERRRERGAALRDGRGRSRPDRREGDRDRNAVGAGDGPGRHAGVGPHQGDQRRLQLAREEGSGDREDRAGAVRGGARVGARELPGRRRDRSPSWRRRPKTPSCSTSAPRQLFERKAIAQADLDTARATMRAANGDVVAARGNHGPGQGGAPPGAGEPRLHDDRVADDGRGDLAQRRRRADGGGVAVGADAVPDRRGPDQDAGRHQRRRGRHRQAEARAWTRPSRSTRTRRRTFKGKIRQIRNAPQTQQNVVTYDAVIDVSNAGLELKPGMTANVTFIYDHRDSALRVANAALRFQPPRRAGARGLRGRRRIAWRRRAARRRQQRRRRDGAAAGVSGGGAGGETPDRRTLWVLRGPTPTPVRVRAGVSDGTNTEIETTELQRGRPGRDGRRGARRRQQAGARGQRRVQADVLGGRCR